MVLSFLRACVNGIFQPERPRPVARRPYRPQLTQLEDRTLCSTDILTALVNPVVLPPGVIGGPYNIQFSVGGKIAPYSYSINVPLSIVPRGMGLTGLGALRGTPQQFGNFPI